MAAQNLLRYDLGPESRRIWTEAFAGWKRLETLLEKSGGKMALGVLDQNPLFTELCKYFRKRERVKSPMIAVNGLRDYKLPHDNHPTREGHRIIALSYIYSLVDLGWLPVKIEELPRLDPKTAPKTDNSPSAERIVALKREKIEKFLDDNIAFDRLDEGNVVAFLGGIYPGKHKDKLDHYPFGSLKSGFLLKRKKGAKELLLEIEVPPRIELYPFNLEMSLNGRLTTELVLGNETEAGKHTLEALRVNILETATSN